MLFQRNNRFQRPLGSWFVMSLAAILGVSAWLTPRSAWSADDARDEVASACDGRMEPYVRSASRKLARALSGLGYRLEPLELPTEWTIERDGQRITLSAFSEKDGAAWSLIDRSRKTRRSYVMVASDRGPVIASQRWPTASEVDGECQPIDSTVEFPSVDVRSIDVTPFKYWGLRVSWHLPKTGSASREDPETILERVIVSSPSGTPSSPGESARDTRTTTPDHPDRSDSNPH